MEQSKRYIQHSVCTQSIDLRISPPLVVSLVVGRGGYAPFVACYGVLRENVLSSSRLSWCVSRVKLVPESVCVGRSTVPTTCKIIIIVISIIIII